jgi:hypothetical protein
MNTNKPNNGISSKDSLSPYRTKIAINATRTPKNELDVYRITIFNYKKLKISLKCGYFSKIFSCFGFLTNVLYVS